MYVGGGMSLCGADRVKAREYERKRVGDFDLEKADGKAAARGTLKASAVQGVDVLQFVPHFASSAAAAAALASGCGCGAIGGASPDAH